MLRRESATPVRGRVDTLLAGAHVTLALVGRPGAASRFLPHDDLVLFAGRPPSIRGAIALPPYTSPPGLAANPTGARMYAAFDRTLIAIDGRSGRVRARIAIDQSAVGWPAAIAAGTALIYLAGQPPAGYAARLEALDIASFPPVVRWRASLGLTHAGIWVGSAGPHTVAVYLPDAHDLHGVMTIYDSATGAQVRSYGVPGAPTAASPSANRLYLVDGGVRALVLSSGVPVVAHGGDAPGAARSTGAAAPGVVSLAVDPEGRYIAFARDDTVVLADARTLRPLASLAVPAITALAFVPGAPRIRIGTRTALVTAGLHSCAAR